MTTIICYILFLVLNGMAFYLLNKQETLVRLPYEKDRYMLCSGPECFVLFIFWTGLLGIQPLLAIRLALLEVFCIVGIFKAQGKVIWSLANDAVHSLLVLDCHRIDLYTQSDVRHKDDS